MMLVADVDASCWGLRVEDVAMSREARFGFGRTSGCRYCTVAVGRGGVGTGLSKHVKFFEVWVKEMVPYIKWEPPIFEPKFSI
jgi:hypothetical protein